MRWSGALGALAVVACAPSSGGSCPSTGSLEVSLADTNSEAPICNATVTLSSAGGSAQPLAAEGSGNGCHYFIAVTAGTYTLTAMAMGYVALSQPLTVTPEGCTVESLSIALELLPSM
jgi:hypothetical protein